MRQALLAILTARDYESRQQVPSVIVFSSNGTPVMVAEGAEEGLIEAP